MCKRRWMKNLCLRLHPDARAISGAARFRRNKQATRHRHVRARWRAVMPRKASTCALTVRAANAFLRRERAAMGASRDEDAPWLTHHGGGASSASAPHADWLMSLSPTPIDPELRRPEAHARPGPSALLRKQPNWRRTLMGRGDGRAVGGGTTNACLHSLARASGRGDVQV